MGEHLVSRAVDHGSEGMRTTGGQLAHRHTLLRVPKEVERDGTVELACASRDGAPFSAGRPRRLGEAPAERGKESGGLGGAMYRAAERRVAGAVGGRYGGVEGVDVGHVGRNLWE